jgi:glucose/arabinose dehydrogenase
VRRLFLLTLAAALPWLAACGDGGGPPGGEPTLRFRPITSTFAALPAGYRLETVLEGLSFPTALAAAPDGRLFIAEQTAGAVRVVQDGRLLPEPWLQVPVRFVEDVFLQELGLVGVAVDPRFEENRFVYIYYTEGAAGSAQRTVFARARDEDGRGVDLTELLAIDLAPEQTHVAGAIAFDGDDAILLGVGDHEQPELAQRLDSPAGKILRIDRDGNPLPDNPFAGRDDADARVYAYGVRNPFGIAVDRATGRAFFTENRNVSGDAVYELAAGADYGWPDRPNAFREPVVIYERPMGLAGATVYQGTTLEAFTGDLFFCSYHQGGALHWSEPEATGFELGLRDRLIGPGCSTGVAEGADGFLYFLSHGDGRLLRISR